MEQALIRWGGLSAMLASLAWFVGYAGFAQVLLPTISQMGGHAVLGLAGLLILPALAGLFARDAGRTAKLGGAAYVLAIVGAAVFAAGNLVEAIWRLEVGTRLFAVGIMTLIAGTSLLGYGMLRAKVLPSWSVWPLIVGWATFLPAANAPSVFGLASGAAYIAWTLSSGILLGAGWATLGYALWSGQENAGLTDRTSQTDAT